MFKKIYITTLFFLCSTMLYAEPAYNVITFPLSAEKWVATQTANVSVGVNATIKSSSLTELHESLIKNLNKIAPASWHITQFEPTTDTSGLTKVSVKAEARVNSKYLNSLNNQTKQLSHPGVNYQINSISFTPSEKELANARMLLRQNIYSMVQTELEHINTLYPKSNYHVYSINFLPELNTNQPMPRGMLLTAVNSNTNTSIGNQIHVRAIVSLQPTENHTDKHVK